MLSADQPSEESPLDGIPLHLLHGPSIITIGQPDGTSVRLSYCGGCRCWHCMLMMVVDNQIVTSPLPPISLITLRQGYA